MRVRNTHLGLLCTPGEVGYDDRTFGQLTALYKKGESRDLVRTLH
jgi:hypothetical protein